jgi:hypothetical protein
MTSSITPVTAASDGGTTTTSERERNGQGLRKLRDREAKALISLGVDALNEACNLGHEMHSVIYDNNASTASYPQLQDQLAEVLTCLETAEHYLLMLGSVFEEHPTRNGPAAAVPD